MNYIEIEGYLDDKKREDTTKRTIFVFNSTEQNRDTYDLARSGF